MAHHMSELPKPMAEEALREGFGATGKFPDGKLREEDEGEIKFGIAADLNSNRLIVNFGKSVASIGMTKEQAIGLAEMITKRAEELV